MRVTPPPGKPPKRASVSTQFCRRESDTESTIREYMP